MEEQKTNTNCSFKDFLTNFKPIRKRFPVNDAFFEEGDRFCSTSRSNKQAIIELDKEEFLCKEFAEFSCHIAGCMKRFRTVLEYENHYNALHRHICQDCRKLFLTNHLLELHIQEFHDALFQLMAEKQNMYRCFVEKCSEKFQDADARKEHLIKSHRYPKDFRYDLLLSKKQRKTVKSRTDDSMDTSQSMNVNLKAGEDNLSMDFSTNSTGIAIKYKPRLPKSICFGQGVSRGFVSHPKKEWTEKKKYWHQKKDDGQITSIDIDNVTFSDMENALPDAVVS